MKEERKEGRNEEMKEGREGERKEEMIVSQMSSFLLLLFVKSVKS